MTINSEKQARYRNRNEKKGLFRAEFWLTKEEKEFLRKKLEKFRKESQDE